MRLKLEPNSMLFMATCLLYYFYRTPKCDAPFIRVFLAVQLEHLVAGEFKYCNLQLPLDVTVYIAGSETLQQLTSLLIEGVDRQLRAMMKCLAENIQLVRYLFSPFLSRSIGLHLE